MKIRLLVVIVFTMMLSACFTQKVVNKAMINNINYSVRLDPHPMPLPGSVNILSKPQGANRAGKQNGYVGYAPGEQGFTVFSIKGEDPGDTCDTGADWVITKLSLASQGDATTEKGSNFGVRQDDWLDDAFPGVSPRGVLFPKPSGPQEVTSLRVYNANGTREPVNVYYEVTLTDCSDPTKTLTTDPMWGNGGKK